MDFLWFVLILSFEMGLHVYASRTPFQVEKCKENNLDQDNFDGIIQKDQNKFERKLRENGSSAQKNLSYKYSHQRQKNEAGIRRFDCAK